MKIFKCPLSERVFVDLGSEIKYEVNEGVYYKGTLIGMAVCYNHYGNPNFLEIIPNYSGLNEYFNSTPEKKYGCIFKITKATDAGLQDLVNFMFKNKIEFERDFFEIK